MTAIVLAAGGLVAAPRAAGGAETAIIWDDVRWTYDRNGCVANCTTPPKIKYVFGMWKNGVWSCCTTISKKSGSGEVADECANPNGSGNYGWIPTTDQPAYDNQYWVEHHESWGGQSVHGTVWRIYNSLYSGSPSWANCDGDQAHEREDLLIHSEMTDDHRQTNCGPPGDSPTCWEGNGDYYSWACIKVSFVDIHNNLGQTYGVYPSLDWYFHNRGGSDGTVLKVVA